jgi:type II secretory ATPase GspE/PulE/Tfp pilus assembly ATPase PilB-like protein
MLDATIAFMSSSAQPHAFPGVAMLGEALVLMSWWKPILLLIPFIPWAIIVSRILDKHAARWFLPRTAWNTAHISAALVALLVAILLPIPAAAAIWVALGIVIVILVADILIFALITNKDERVPAEFRLTLDLSKYREAQAKKAANKKAGQVELVMRAADKTTLGVPDTDSPEFQVRVAAEQALIDGMEARAAQIEFVPTGKDNAYAVIYVVDGVRQQAASLPGADALKVMDVWKAGAKLDVADRRRKQSADMTIDRGDTRKAIRVYSIGSQAGMKVTLSIEPSKQVRRKITELGLFEPQLKEVQDLITLGLGTVIITGPQDGGRTTTMYAIVRAHDAYTKNVNTLELEIQDEIEGVRQNVFDPHSESGEYSTTARSLIRRDPDVLALAEVPDPATAKEAAKADGERARIYLCMRSDSAMQAIQSYIQAVGDVELALKHLKGAISHRLVRTLCTNCRVPYQPPPEMLKKMGLPADRVKQLFKKGGQVLIKNKPDVCPMCKGTGYYGQTGIFEVITLNDADRALIRAGDFNGVRAELRKRNVLTLQQAALRRAIEGATSVEEIGRMSEQQTPAPVGGAPVAQAPKPAPAPAKN